MSLRQSARIFEKHNGGPVPLAAKKRKRYRQQLRVMAEATRRRIRVVLRNATSISLSLDESKYRKIVRFRADLPSAHKGPPGSHVGASGFSMSGVLGVLDCSKKHAEGFEEDHAVTDVHQTEAFITRFCTLLGRLPGRRQPHPLAYDEDLKTHIKDKSSLHVCRRRLEGAARSLPRGAQVR